MKDALYLASNCRYFVSDFFHRKNMLHEKDVTQFSIAHDTCCRLPALQKNACKNYYHRCWQQIENYFQD